MKIPSVLEKIVATKIDEVEQRKSARPCAFPLFDLIDFGRNNFFEHAGNFHWADS